LLTMTHEAKSGITISIEIREAELMYCTKCEFEIKGEGRKECPICGGPLIDFSSLASETPEDQPIENSQETTSESTFDLASLLNDDDKVSEKGPEPEAPPIEECSTKNVETPSFEKTGETPNTSTSALQESASFDLEGALKAEEEKHRPEPETEQNKENLSNFETVLNQDKEKQPLESEEPARISSLSEHKPEAEPEPPLEELSTEELLRRIAREYKTAEKDVEAEPVAAVPQPRGPKQVPVRPSRSISAIAALAVFALLAAIASIAYLTPQEKLHPTIAHVKTEAEKKINEITDLVIIKVEKYLYQQKEPSSSLPQQKARPERPVNKTALAKKPPAQEKPVSPETKPAVVNKIVPAESENTAPQEPTQPEAETAKDIPPQEKPAPQVVEKQEKTPFKPTDTKSSRGGLYSLHTGSFTKESIASGEAERLRRMGFESYIQKVSLKNGQTWYRVKVGDFTTRKEAEDIEDKLKHKAPHIQAYVMKKTNQ
jgi:cell division protein FtsN